MENYLESEEAFQAFVISKFFLGSFFFFFFFDDMLVFSDISSSDSYQ